MGPATQDVPSSGAAFAHRVGAYAQLVQDRRPKDALRVFQRVGQFGPYLLEAEIADGMGGYAHNAAIHVIVPPGKLVRVFGMGQHHEALAFAAGLAQ